jgi:hypothetical protein
LEAVGRPTLRTDRPEPEDANRALVSILGGAVIAFGVAVGFYLALRAGPAFPRLWYFVIGTSALLVVFGATLLRHPSRSMVVMSATVSWMQIVLIVGLTARGESFAAGPTLAWMGIALLATVTAFASRTASPARAKA